MAIVVNVAVAQFRPRKGDYVSNLFNIVNWDNAAQRLEAVRL